MNKTEAAYAGEVLEAARASGEVLGWFFEPGALRLAKDLRYYPDFLVIYSDRVAYVEIKGTHAEDDAIAKWKMAAEMHWWAEFRWIEIKMRAGSIESMKEKVYTP